MINKTENRGGARKNAGAPKKYNKRKQLRTSIDEHTDSKLRSISEREKISIGKVIDGWGEGRLLE